LKRLFLSGAYMTRWSRKGQSVLTEVPSALHIISSEERKFRRDMSVIKSASKKKIIQEQ
jgi:hypothetical protein